MAMNEGQDNVNTLTWENCPSEILMMIFEMMPAPSLAVSMFVSSRWKKLVEHVVERNNKWEEIVKTSIINKGAQFMIKSNRSFGWQQIYYNYILWNNVHKSTIVLHQVQALINIIGINIYRDNLIVVSHKNVRYYHVKRLNLLRTVEISCLDYIENDHMIAVALGNYGSYLKLELFKKSSIDDFNITRNNVCQLDQVMFYHVDCNQCYVLNHRNILIVYAIMYPSWDKMFSARYYGSPYESCAMNVFDGHAYLLLKNGSVLWADMAIRRFRKVLHIKAPYIQRIQSAYCKMFHRYGFVFGVPGNESVTIDRFTLFKNNVFVYGLPRLSCMAQHGDILILGYLDGKIEFLSPRDLTKKEPLRRFNIKDFKNDIKDPKVISIDVHEDNGIQHLFIATNSEIFQLHITHPNCEDYMWKKYTNLVTLMADKSAEGLAFKNRTD